MVQKYTVRVPSVGVKKSVIVISPCPTIVATDANEVWEPVIPTYRVPYHPLLLGVVLAVQEWHVLHVTGYWRPLSIDPRPRKLLLTG